MPLGVGYSHLSAFGRKAQKPASSRLQRLIEIWGRFASKALPFFFAVAPNGRGHAVTASPSTP